MEKKKLLFFSIPYDKGWHATVDGKEMEPQLVNIGFMGLILDKGMHDVVLQFKPPYVKESLWISIIGLCLYLLLAAYWFYRKKHMMKQKTHTAEAVS